jgi:hypothetical protein
MPQIFVNVMSTYEISLEMPAYRTETQIREGTQPFLQMSLLTSGDHIHNFRPLPVKLHIYNNKEITLILHIFTFRIKINVIFICC